MDKKNPELEEANLKKKKQKKGQVVADVKKTRKTCFLKMRA